MHAMQTEIQELIGAQKPGYDMTQSPLAYSEDKKDSGFVFIKMP